MAIAYTYGGFNFNDNVNFYVVEKPYDIVSFKQSLFKIARLEGMKKTGEVVNERSISVKVKVVAATRIALEQALENLYAALALRQQQLIIYATDQRYFIADCTDVQATLSGNLPISAVVTIKFTAQQPWAFAPTQSTYTTGSLTLTGSASSWTWSTTPSFTGGGSIYARPQIRIQQTGTAVAWTSLSLSQSNDGQTITITTSLPSANGDYIDIFGDPTLPGSGFTVQKNSSNTPIAFTGLFPVVEPVSTMWFISIAAATAPQITTTWTWTPRWMA